RCAWECSDSPGSAIATGVLASQYSCVVRAVVEAMCQVPMKWSTTCVMCLLFCRCWQCGALQQPGGYPQVDHHQPEQPQFDYEAELALVAQFQEQFHELDQALTALQPHPDPPAQPARTPLRLFNRFALLDLESGVQKEQEVMPQFASICLNLPQFAHLKHNAGMDLQELFMWSDGCAGQFK
ncbi:hypothetical protein QJQ45_015035, partial [Haematococcus lacustris]